MDKLLKLLKENSRLSNKELAVMTDMTESEVENQIDLYRKNGIICGYKVILNYDKLNIERVAAFIEVKIETKNNSSFDDVGKIIMKFDEVDSVFLISGEYDMSVHVTGKSFKEVCMFVSSRLATIDCVISTRTNFVLSQYKDSGIITREDEQDERRYYLL